MDFTLFAFMIGAPYLVVCIVVGWSSYWLAPVRVTMWAVILLGLLAAAHYLAGMIALDADSISIWGLIHLASAIFCFCLG